MNIMGELFKVVIFFTMTYFGIVPILVLILLVVFFGALIYIWYQYNHMKILQERSESMETLKDEQINFLKAKLEITNKYPHAPP